MEIQAAPENHKSGIQVLLWDSVWRRLWFGTKLPPILDKQIGKQIDKQTGKQIQSRRACQILTGLKCLTVIILGIIKWDTLSPIRETPTAPANLILF